MLGRQFPRHKGAADLHSHVQPAVNLTVSPSIPEQGHIKRVEQDIFISTPIRWGWWSIAGHEIFACPPPGSLSKNLATRIQDRLFPFWCSKMIITLQHHLLRIDAIGGQRLKNNNNIFLTSLSEAISPSPFSKYS